MSEQTTMQFNPARSLGIPTVPAPQTNMGFLEHTGIPFEPIDPITDIPPDFSWMVSQWKYVDQFEINVNQQVNQMIYTSPIVRSNNLSYTGTDNPNWLMVPFGFSKWWNGAVSFRFTAIKPPRVTGKLLVMYRQDGFKDLEAKDSNPGSIRDLMQRSILKEWDLSQSSQFEFDITGSMPIRARPAQWTEGSDPFNSNPPQTGTAYAPYYYPYSVKEMGSFQILVAQQVSPGGIFPDKFTILVEKSIKMPMFMTPTDSRTNWQIAINK